MINFMSATMENYFQYLERLPEVLNSKPAQKAQKRYQLHKNLPGLTNLMKSFADHMLIELGASTRVMEWNPLSQRLLLSDIAKTIRENEYRFEVHTRTVNEFILAAHEAIHVLLWEVFFCGHFNPTSKKEWIRTSTIFEGFAFWYADLVLTPYLREPLPNGEFMNSRACMSSFHFHPYPALRAVGVQNSKQALSLYLKAFGFKNTKLLHSENIYTKNLAHRIYNFYKPSVHTLGLAYDSLRSSQVFQKFYKDFCNVSDLPTLLPPKFCFDGNIEKYCKWLAHQGLEYIHGLGADQIHKIKVRRQIQTRAYFLFLLKTQVKENKVRKSSYALLSSAETTSLLKIIEDSLAELRGCLNVLREGHVRKSQELLSACDRTFSMAFEKYQKMDLWICRRHLILPGISGLGSYQVSLPLDHRQIDTTVAERVVDHFVDESTKSQLSLSAKQELYKRASQVHNSVWALKGSPVLKNRIRLSRDLEKFLWCLPVRKLWSIPLTEIKPTQSYFRELLFSYD